MPTLYLPLTETLYGAGATDEQKIAIVEQSIERGWKTLYPLKDEKEEQKNGFDSKKYEFLINNF